MVIGAFVSQSHWSSSREEGAASVSAGADALETRVDGGAAKPDSELPAAESTFGRGDVLGRYVVVDTVGKGGMGVVLSAYDTELGRRVALKVILHRKLREAEGRERLRREAQALAKLSHPNVVSVYDVGDVRGQVFIAMEYIDGPNLRDWLVVTPQRPWQEVLRAYAAAGRGLAAAHARGIVHRDFKPDNALIGADGRVRVTDFGLARIGDASGSEDFDAVDDSGTSLQITRTGAVIGTPAYMPIEQHQGAAPDPRSDQFSFCVSLYEALYGYRPFEGRTREALSCAVLRGELLPPPPHSPVPSRVFRALERGLRPQRERRHDTMNALLRALRVRRSERSWKWWAAGGGGVVLGALGVTWSSGAEDVPCGSMDEHLRDRWGPSTRQRLTAALVDPEQPYARNVERSVAEALDRYATSWVEARTRACRATAAGEQSEALLDRSMACLDARLERFDATVEVLTSDDPGMLRAAPSVVEALPSLSPCSNPAALASVMLGSDDPTVEALSRVLHRSATMRVALRFEDAEALLEEHRSSLEAATYPPLMTRYARELGQVFLAPGREPDRGQVHFERAYTIAVENGMFDAAARAASTLVRMYGAKKVRLEDAEFWSMHALALAEASGAPSERALVLRTVSSHRNRQGRYEESVAMLEEALEIHRQEAGPESLAVARTMEMLGERAITARNFAAAVPRFEQARGLYVRALGEGHPWVAGVSQSLATCALEMGEYAEARVLLEAQVEIARASGGGDTMLTARALVALGNAEYVMGDTAAARGLWEEALTIVRQRRAPTHPDRLRLVANLATLDLKDGNLTEALEGLNEVVARQREAFGGPHVDLAMTLSNVGEVYRKLARWSDARDAFASSVAMLETVLGPTAQRVGIPLTGLGLVFLEQGEVAEAVAVLERSHALGRAEPRLAAETDFALGRALMAEPAADAAQRRRAIGLVRDAAVHLPELQDPAVVEQARAWLDAHADEPFGDAPPR